MERKIEAFNKIATALYASNNLSYHNMEHINSVLEHANFLSMDITGEKVSSTLYLAILYHEAVINPRRIDNKRKSAALFRQIGEALDQLSYKIDYDALKASDLIELTGRHLFELDSSSLDIESKIILDADLADLANTSFADHLNIAKKIRWEHTHLSNQQFNEGRIDYLNRLIHKKEIFYTDAAKEHYEDIAIYNIKHEILLLRHGEHA